MKSTMKKELIGRWERESKWINEAREIRKRLLNSGESEFIKLDLRGFKISVNADLVPNIEGKVFNEIDFSYANFSRCRFSKCKFKKSIFSYTNLSNIIEQESEFTDCYFYKGKINGFIGEWGSLYRNVKFEGVNLAGINMQYPSFRNCEFQNCNLKRAEFNGAVIDNVKFIGTVSDVRFRGKYRIAGAVPPPGFDYRRMHMVNPMNVDFSQATISYTLFTDGCDLSSTILPNDGKHYLINDIKSVKKFVSTFCDNLSEEEKGFFTTIQRAFLFQYDGEKMKVINSVDWFNSMTKDEGLKERASSVFDKFMNQLRDNGLIISGW